MKIPVHGKVQWNDPLVKTAYLTSSKRYEEYFPDSSTLYRILPAVCSLPRLTVVSWNSAAYAKLMLTANLITHHFCQCLYLIQEKQFHIVSQAGVRACWFRRDRFPQAVCALLKVPSANMPQCLQSVCCLPSPFLGLSPEEAPGIIISLH